MVGRGVARGARQRAQAQGHGLAGVSAEVHLPRHQHRVGRQGGSPGLLGFPVDEHVQDDLCAVGGLLQRRGREGEGGAQARAWWEREVVEVGSGRGGQQQAGHRALRERGGVADEVLCGEAVGACAGPVEAPGFPGGGRCDELRALERTPGGDRDRAALDAPRGPADGGVGARGVEGDRHPVEQHLPALGPEAALDGGHAHRQRGRPHLALAVLARRSREHHPLGRDPAGRSVIWECPRRRQGVEVQHPRAAGLHRGAPPTRRRAGGEARLDPAHRVGRRRALRPIRAAAARGRE